MTITAPLELYTTLGFEEIDVEDNLTALFCETNTDGSYVLLTDEEGCTPTNLKKPVILALYTPEGSYQWSASFKNSYLFQETWSIGSTMAEKLAAILAHRENTMVM